jgi:hypothetical protein
MLVAVAVPRLTAPCTSLTTEVSLTVELELVSDLLATRLATVLVEELAEELTLWDEEEFLEEAIFLLAELLEDSANCEDLLAEADSASCEALEEAALVAKLFDFELLAVNPLLEFLLLESLVWSALLDVLALLVASVLLELLADALLAAMAAFAASEAFAAALLDVALSFVALCPLCWFAEALWFDSDALMAAFAFNDFVAEASLEELEPVDALWLFPLFAARLAAEDAFFELLVCNALFDAETSDVELDLLALLAAEADSVADAFLLALACCALSLVAVKLFEELLLLELSFMYDLLSLAEWFREALMLEESLLFFVTFELLLTVNWVLAPRW